jgi:hypothetical protein
MQSAYYQIQTKREFAADALSGLAFVGGRSAHQLATTSTGQISLDL